MSILNIEISKHTRDIIQKYTSGLFRNATLEFYGIKTAKIKELINVELPVVEVAETSTDFIFLLEDDTYLHFEFQTAHNKNDLVRFALYDLRLYERDKRKIRTVIIYASDVRKTDDRLDIGSFTYAPDKVMMYEYDGNAIYADLESKLNSRQDLTDADMLNLIFLPLMKNDVDRIELVEKTIAMAQTIPDKTKRNICVGSAFAFSIRYLSDKDINRILEVVKMANLDTVLTKLIIDDRIEIAKKLLKKGLSVDDIAESTGLDVETINELQVKEDCENDRK